MGGQAAAKCSKYSSNSPSHSLPALAILELEAIGSTWSGSLGVAGPVDGSTGHKLLFSSLIPVVVASQADSGGDCSSDRVSPKVTSTSVPFKHSHLWLPYLWYLDKTSSPGSTGC